MTENKPIEIFISYSHKDEALRDELANHLSALKRQGLISSWHDRRILPGSEWEGKIDEHLNTAQIILLLISSDFLASDYCMSNEMTQALARHEAGEAQVIPIALRKCDWEIPELQRLQALPKNAEPVTSWEDQDAAFTDIARGIRRVISDFKAKTPVPDNPPPPPDQPEAPPKQSDPGAPPPNPTTSIKNKWPAVLIAIVIVIGILIAGAIFKSCSPPPLTPTPTSTPSNTAIETQACFLQGVSDEFVLESLIKAEAQAVMHKEEETIPLIFADQVMIIDAYNGYRNEDPVAHYENKRETENHRNILHTDFDYEYPTSDSAIVMTHVTGEWYDNKTQMWEPYAKSPNEYDINRWEFVKLDGCWRISGLTYNLSMVTPTP